MNSVLHFSVPSCQLGNGFVGLGINGKREIGSWGSLGSFGSMGALETENWVYRILSGLRAFWAYSNGLTRPTVR